MALSRDEMLRGAICYAAEVGLTDFSMRGCAAAIGTSHRMLGYHFGTKDELIGAVVDAVSQREGAGIDAFVADTSITDMTGEDIDAVFAGLLADEEQLRMVGLLGEATYRLGKSADPTPTYEALVQLWAPHVTALLGLEDLPEERREARVRLAVAVQVGLSMDYVGTRDARAYVSASREWVRMNLGK